MHKILLLALLISFNAQAEWIKVASLFDDDNTNFYVSSESIKKTGVNTRSAWEVVNYLKQTRQDYLSAKVHQEYDCKSNQARVLFASTHSEVFGKGKTIRSSQELPSPWHEIPEHSVAAYTKNYICSKKL